MADKKSDPKDKKEAVTIGDKDEMSMGGDTAPKSRKKADKEEKKFCLSWLGAGIGPFVCAITFAGVFASDGRVLWSPY